MVHFAVAHMSCVYQNRHQGAGQSFRYCMRKTSSPITSECMHQCVHE